MSHHILKKYTVYCQVQYLCRLLFFELFFFFFFFFLSGDRLWEGDLKAGGEGANLKSRDREGVGAVPRRR